MSIDDEEAIAIAAEHALAHIGAANRISLTPIVGGRDGWARLRLEPEHRAYETCSRLATYDQAAAYETQNRLLSSVVGDDLFVATYSPFERADGSLSSYCTWSKGVEALLPEAEHVAFNSKESNPFLVPWEVAREVCSDLLEPTGHEPIRWRVLDFPSAIDLRILRDHEI